jgi:hypothetical protein
VLILCVYHSMLSENKLLPVLVVPLHHFMEVCVNCRCMLQLFKYDKEYIFLYGCSMPRSQHILNWWTAGRNLDPEWVKQGLRFTIKKVGWGAFSRVLTPSIIWTHISHGKCLELHDISFNCYIFPSLHGLMCRIAENEPQCFFFSLPTNQLIHWIRWLIHHKTDCYSQLL